MEIIFPKLGLEEGLEFQQSLIISMIQGGMSSGKLSSEGLYPSIIICSILLQVFGLSFNS